MIRTKSLKRTNAKSYNNLVDRPQQAAPLLSASSREASHHQGPEAAAEHAAAVKAHRTRLMGLGPEAAADKAVRRLAASLAAVEDLASG